MSLRRRRPLRTSCSPPSEYGMMWAACSTGKVLSLVIAQRRLYASVTTTLNVPCPRRGRMGMGSPYLGSANSATPCPPRRVPCRRVSTSRQRFNPVRVFRAVSLATHDFRAPIGRNRDPPVFWKKERLLKENASNRVIGRPAPGNAPVLGDAVAHFVKCSGAVFFAERLPRQADRQQTEMPEEPPADDEVPRAVELKKERFTRSEGPETVRPARLPEVDLVQALY